MSEIPLDLNALSSLFGDDVATQNAILGEYNLSLSEYMVEFEAALNTRSAGGVQAVTHKMKSSSRTVGAIPLADLCEVLEQAGKRGDWRQIENRTASFIASVEAVKNCIAEDR